MRRPGPPISSDEDRRRLALWLLDKTRQALPINYKDLVQDLYRVENKLEEDRPINRYAGEELIQFRIVAPDAMWLHEGQFSMPQYNQDKPAFENQSVVMVPSYNYPAVHLRFEVEGRFPPIA